jgi:imidazolonepropionase-like amidohydrolase
MTLLSLAALALSVSTCETRPLVVTRALLWNQAATSEILVENGRISALGERVPRPDGARILDAEGSLVLPGLIDSHAHFVWPGPMPKDAPSAWPATARQTLASGVTTVRVHLSDLEEGAAIRREADDDCFPAPRIELGGRGLLGGSPEVEARLIWGVKSAEDARDKVRRVRDSGAAWLALHSAEGFSPEELAAIQDEAGKLGIRLFASGDTFEEIRAAVPVGVETLEYLNLSEAPEYPADVMALFAERKDTLAFVPPLGFYTRFMAYRREPSAVRNPLHASLLPGEVTEALFSALEAQFASQEPNEYATTLASAYPTLQRKFLQLVEAGLSVVVGSDSGSEGNFHADAIWWELRAWRDLGGREPAAILEAATTRPARLLGRLDIGALKAGARADFFVYRGDFAAGDFDATKARTVVKGGVIHVSDGAWVSAAH